MNVCGTEVKDQLAPIFASLPVTWNMVGIEKTAHYVTYKFDGGYPEGGGVIYMI